MTKSHQGISDFMRLAQGLTCEQVGALFVEYVLEADHGGWDGVGRDLPAINRFLADLVTYSKHSDPTTRSPVIFTGSSYATKDR